MVKTNKVSTSTCFSKIVIDVNLIWKSKYAEGKGISDAVTLSFEFFINFIEVCTH